MLRHYDEIGLLVPAKTDEFTLYRYYSEDQLATAARINELKDMGFGLSAISEVLRINSSASYESALMVKAAELREQADRTSRQLGMVDKAIEKLRIGDIYMNYTVSMKIHPRHNRESALAGVLLYVFLTIQ